jgi:hypothetical protein
VFPIKQLIRERERERYDREETRGIVTKRQKERETVAILHVVYIYFSGHYPEVNLQLYV